MPPVPPPKPPPSIVNEVLASLNPPADPGPAPPHVLAAYPGVEWDAGSGLYWSPDGRWAARYDPNTETLKPLSTTEMKNRFGGGGGAAGPTEEELALIRIRTRAEEQQMELAAAEEERAAEKHPLSMEQMEATMGYNEGMLEVAQEGLERQQLQDQWQRAMDIMSAARLAEDLASEKKLRAVQVLSSIAEYLIPPGMEYMPGTEPGGFGEQLFGQLGLPFEPMSVQPTAQVDFQQFTGMLEPQTDQAVQYLMQLQQRMGGPTPTGGMPGMPAAPAAPAGQGGYNPQSGWEYGSQGWAQRGGT